MSCKKFYHFIEEIIKAVAQQKLKNQSTKIKEKQPLAHQTIIRGKMCITKRNTQIEQRLTSRESHR